MKGFIDQRNDKSGDDLFVLMEKPPASGFAASFAGLSTKPFWIVNQSSAVALRDVLFDSPGTYGFTRTDAMWSRCDL